MLQIMLFGGPQARLSTTPLILPYAVSTAYTRLQLMQPPPPPWIRKHDHCTLVSYFTLCSPVHFVGVAYGSSGLSRNVYMMSSGIWEDFLPPIATP